jgi:DNA helicase II / ATP-dependent DNA helicase PcrA
VTADQISSPNDRDAGVVDEIVGYVTSTPPKSFFLFAGAGSGKTRTLVAVLRKLTGVGTKEQQPQATQKHDLELRFARELRARAQTIRVITYTKNAALVVTGRLGLNDLAQVSTIHSFCWELISGFDADIREALLSLNSAAQAKARGDADGRKNGWTEKDKETIAELEAKAIAIAGIDNFTYSPDRNKYGDGALHHAQVLSIAAWLLRQRPTLRRILRDQHPVILIDESQDTMKSVLDALLDVVKEDPTRLMLGLLGDHRQRIYLDGHVDLPSAVPQDWATPKLEMNHRSQRRIVDLINAIWEAELEGRTQPINAVRQHPREEKSAGLVRVFIGDTKLPPAEKVRREALCAAAMETATKNADWRPGHNGFTVLALEHSLVARRGDFSEAFDAISLIDPESVKPDPNGDSTGPAVIQVLLREMMELADCVNAGKVSSEFEATEVLHRYGRLQNLPAEESARGVQLKAFSQAVYGFAKACANPKATVRDVLSPVIQGGLFEMNAKLVAAFNDTSEPPEPPQGKQKELTETRIARGWHALFNAPWTQLRAFKVYLTGNSKLATHQVVKGSEFDHVMVVMDDKDAEGNLFAYDRLFGAPLGDSDIKNMGAQKETSIDRTVRLLYVTCSRAKESLGLVLWARDAAQALAYAQESKWFSAGEVHPMPD